MEKVSSEDQKFHHVMIALCCVDAPLQVETYIKGAHYFLDQSADENLAQYFSNKKKDLKTEYLPLYSWGYFDIMEIMKFEKMETFLDLQELIPYTHTYDQRYHCGTLVYHDYNFSFNTLATSYPLTGVSFVKFKEEFFGVIQEGRLLEFFNSFIPELFKRHITKPWRVDDIRYSIIWSWGWEDIIILWFSKSYELIKHLICKLRALKITDVEKLLDKDWRKKLQKKFKKKNSPLKHCVKFTMTIFS
ncbi:hypothetical protein J7K43_07210, partial [Candidatus Calescamantes bacterium]|nr:hypothetical protein [Candidatus Calescamantes bacterium]